MTDTTHRQASLEHDSSRALTGIRVVDLTQNIAGPHCTQILADLGADVIKVEPLTGDPTRQWGPPFWEGESPLFLAVNRNKRSIVLDLKSDDGKDVLGRLVDRADIFVQAFRAGVIGGCNRGSGFGRFPEARWGRLCSTSLGDAGWVRWTQEDWLCMKTGSAPMSRCLLSDDGTTSCRLGSKRIDTLALAA